MLKTNEMNISKIIDLKYNSLCEIDKNTKITPSLAIMINNYIDNIKMNEHNSFEYKKIRYLKEKKELSLKNNYNNLIVNLYQNGKILINNEECNLKDLYILYKKGDNKYYLTYSKSTYTDYIRKSNSVFPYDTAVKFIDSTAFIVLINNPTININENTIIIDNNNTFLDILNNWDELLHNRIWFTESINNKKILEDSLYGK